MLAGSLEDMVRLTPRDAAGVATAVSGVLQTAIRMQVSDLHLLPTKAGLELAWRRDGVMQVVGLWPAELSANVVSRLKVLAELLTYRTDLPQEGRLRHDPALSAAGIEMRLSTFPTLHGEKAVIRLFVGSGEYRQLNDLGLPPETLSALRTQLQETSGCIVLSGPAGSGKTTTAYACLREILDSRQRGRSVVTLEDPIEAELPGASQTQVHRPAEFTYGLGLRSLMRQDPDVIFVGEIRDAETAETTFQASLTGHLVLTTLHAGNCGQAVTRLRDLGVEPYLLRTGLRSILCQRLLRRRCDCLPTAGTRTGTEAAAADCPRCWGTGYRGRILIAELLTSELFAAIAGDLDQLSAHRLQQLALEAGLQDLAARGLEVLKSGRTTEAELLRVLGQLPVSR